MPLKSFPAPPLPPPTPQNPTLDLSLHHIRNSSSPSSPATPQEIPPPSHPKSSTPSSQEHPPHLDLTLSRPDFNVQKEEISSSIGFYTDCTQQIEELQKECVKAGGVKERRVGEGGEQRDEEEKEGGFREEEQVVGEEMESEGCVEVIEGGNEGEEGILDGDSESEEEDLDFEVVHTVHSDDGGEQSKELEGVNEESKISPLMEVNTKKENESLLQSQIDLTLSSEDEISKSVLSSCIELQSNKDDTSRIFKEDLTLEFEDLKRLNNDILGEGVSQLRDSYLQASEEVFNLLKVLNKSPLQTSLEEIQEEKKSEIIEVKEVPTEVKETPIEAKETPIEAKEIPNEQDELKEDIEIDQIVEEKKDTGEIKGADKVELELEKPVPKPIILTESNISKIFSIAKSLEKLNEDLGLFNFDLSAHKPDKPVNSTPQTHYSPSPCCTPLKPSKITPSLTTTKQNLSKINNFENVKTPQNIHQSPQNSSPKFYYKNTPPRDPQIQLQTVQDTLQRAQSNWSTQQESLAEILQSVKLQQPQVDEYRTPAPKMFNDEQDLSPMDPRYPKSISPSCNENEEFLYQPKFMQQSIRKRSTSKSKSRKRKKSQKKVQIQEPVPPMSNQQENPLFNYNTETNFYQSKSCNYQQKPCEVEFEKPENTNHPLMYLLNKQMGYTNEDTELDLSYSLATPEAHSINHQPEDNNLEDDNDELDLSSHSLTNLLTQAKSEKKFSFLNFAKQTCEKELKRVKSDLKT
ncbi:unnamed protein product [Moneuplotes crassus]|uniref:Uncharacterized protein n=1 Tax=Euplotes crassus TaxID=5936 RepID=A0AAD1Y167_EUPCR|nr:unnamed protein product [Moneuplotes crassus]